MKIFEKKFSVNFLQKVKIAKLKSTIFIGLAKVSGGKITKVIYDMMCYNYNKNNTV